MKKKLKILLIEDDEADFLLIERQLRKNLLQAEVHWVKDAAGLSRALEETDWNVVLSDYTVPGLNFLKTLESIQHDLRDVPIILISGSIGEETAVELLKSGLSDFVLKDRIVRLVPAIERCLHEQAERIKLREAEATLAKNEQLMRAVLEGTTDAVFVKDRQGRYLLCNEAVARFVGREAGSIIGQDDTFLFQPETAAELMARDRAIMEAGRLRTEEELLTTHRGDRLAFLVTKGPVFDQQGKITGLFGISRDITDWKNAERAQQFNLRLLELVHDHTDISVLISDFVDEIKNFTGCEAVGIRVLDNEGNIPYQAYEGFSDRFFELESPLSIKSDQCMCIKVIRGETDERLPFYTPGGSFYMNGTTRFLATVSEEEKGKTRNVCNRMGYESVALVPFRSKGRIIGLIHVADHQENMVPLPMVELLERAVMQLGTAFQRAHAQMELRESERRLRAIIDNANGIVWVKDLDGRFLVVNTYLVDILGKSRDEIIGHTVFDLVSRNLAEEYTANDRRVLESDVPIEVEEPAMLADGPHTFLSVKFPLRDSTGKIYALSAISTDITRLKKVEASLKEQEEKYRRLSQEYRVLLDNIPDGIVHLSPDFEIRWTNAAAQKMFQLEDNPELRGKACHAAFWNQEERCVPCPVQRSITTRRNEIGSYCPRDKDQEFEIRSVPLIDQSGAMEGIIQIIRDTSAHRRLEQQFRQAQKMESIGTLAGGIAHDFNNILSAILGYGELALEDLADDSPARKSVHTIIEAGLRASHLTKDLLLFSRKQVSDKQPVDVNAIVTKVEKFIRRIIGEDIQCEARLASRPLVILADGHQIEQVLMNFATNARDAMPRGGYFTIATTCLQIDQAFISAHGFGSPGPYVLITVSDTGKGMEKETAEKIFEPFFTTKEMGKGTGLGLAVVYGIIQEHQGYINVYSEPEKGTVFRVYLPLIDKTEKPVPEQAAQDKPRGGKETILLAEDEVTVRRLFITVLEQGGYTVIEAVNGEDAVRKFEANKEHINLLLFDLVMPKMNGKLALEAIRGLKPDIKGIFVSGYAPENIQQRDLFDLHTEVLFKPVSPKELLKTVRKVLDAT